MAITVYFEHRENRVGESPEAYATIAEGFMRWLREAKAAQEQGEETLSWSVTGRESGGREGVKTLTRVKYISYEDTTDRQAHAPRPVRTIPTRTSYWTIDRGTLCHDRAIDPTDSATDRDSRENQGAADGPLGSHTTPVPET